MIMYCHPRVGVWRRIDRISANETARIVYRFLSVKENIIQTNQMWRTSLSWIQSLIFQSTQVFNFPKNHSLMICYLILCVGHHLEAEMLHLSQNLLEDYKGSMSAQSMIQRHTFWKQEGQIKWHFELQNIQQKHQQDQIPSYKTQSYPQPWTV